MTLGRGKKVKYHSLVNFKDFYTKLCVFSQIIDRKHIEQNFHSVAKVIPRDGTRWCWGGGGGGESKTLVWGFAMAPHRLRALVSTFFHEYSC